MPANARLVALTQAARWMMKRRTWLACVLAFLPLAASAQEPARCIELGPATSVGGQYIIPLLIDNMDEVTSSADTKDKREF